MTNYKNWPTAISTGDTSLENFQRFAKANVKGVEVSLRWFDWHRDWGEIVENAKKAGVEVMSYHLPFANEINIANLHDGRRQFAVTVHKAQGSEYRAVILAALDGAPMLMTRGVLYTAITRARDLFIIVGDDGSVLQMIHNDRQTRRYSGLRARLMEFD